MIFELANSLLIVQQGVWELFQAFVQHHPRAPESGGILLGCSLEGEDYVTRASIPTLWDRQQRCLFIRDMRSAQLFIDYEWRNSGGTINYMGEWHTHPEDHPVPSRQDLSMIQQQFKVTAHRREAIFLFIQGRVGIYAGQQTANGFQKLKNKS